MLYKRVFFQKINKVSLRIIDVFREKLIKDIFKKYRYALILYDVVTYSPIENIIMLLFSKLGVSKSLALIIMAFLI